MKKNLLFMSFVISMVFMLFACNKQEIKTNEIAKNEESTSKLESNEITISEDKEISTLVMVTNAEFPPYEYIENNEYVGIDIEIAKAIAEKLEAKLEIMDVSFDSIIPAIREGRGDFAMAGMTITEDRKKDVDFSDTYQKAIQSIIVIENSNITTLDDLAGKKVGVVSGYTGDIYATDDFGEENIERYKDGLAAVNGLVAGKVDCVMIDNQVAKNYVLSKKELKVLDTPYEEEDYAACVKKGNTELLSKINEAIDELRSSGKFDEIVKKYLKK